jgi:hypothetical protein
LFIEVVKFNKKKERERVFVSEKENVEGEQLMIHYLSGAKTPEHALNLGGDPECGKANHPLLSQNHKLVSHHNYQKNNINKTTNDIPQYSPNANNGQCSMRLGTGNPQSLDMSADDWPFSST